MIRVLLNAQDLFEVVSGECKKPTLAKVAGETDEAANDRLASALTAWKKLDGKAQKIIVTALGPQPMLYIMRFDNAHDMWAKLVSVYEQKSETSVHLLQQKFFSAIMEPGDGISEHISKLEDIAQQLKDFGEAIPDSMLVSKILMTLPVEFRHFHSAWESTAVADRTLTNLTTRLMIEECRNGVSNQAENIGESSAMASKRYHQHHHQRQTQQQHHSVKCFQCKKPGHIKKNCPEKNTHKHKFNAHVSSKDNCDAFVSVADFSCADRSDDKWYMDSGASDHMSHNLKWFTNFRKSSKPISVRVGNGDIIFGEGFGDIEIVAYNGVSWIERRMENVLYVPQIKLNLFSAGTALDKGLQQQSDMNECKFLMQGRIVAVGVRRNRLFEMLFKVKSADSSVKHPEVQVHAADSQISLKLWHAKLAHQNIQHVKQFLKSVGISVNSSETFFCDACVYGKQSRKPFKNSVTKTSAPGEIIVSDVCGPMQNPSIRGAKYFIVFKDLYTHYRTVRFMKEKSEVKSILEEYVASVRTDTGCDVKVFRSDNGLEYANNDVKDILAKRGIRHQRTVPYTPEQNGSAEREMRTLVEAGRTMLHAAGMALCMWAEAVNTAVYVLNRTGTSSVIGKTPFELWFGRPASIENLHVFGSVVFTHIPKEKRRKWDVKSQEGVFVGYSENSKAYRVWYPKCNRVEVARDVVFKKVSEYVAIDNTDECSENTPKTNIQEQQPLVNSSVENNKHLYTDESDDGDIFEEMTDKSKIVKKVHPESERLLRSHCRLQSVCKQNDYCANIAQFEEPTTYTEAITCESAKDWMNAMYEEIGSLEKNETWTLVCKPTDRKVIKNRWVFKVKCKPNGSVDRFKARLVARGFSQVFGIDYKETFSPVVKYSSIRMILAVSACEKLKLRQFDIKTAFLNGDLNEDIYMEQPEGFDDSSGRVCLLNRSLYGLKQASRCWNQKFSLFLKKFNLVPSDYDSCVFMNSNSEHRIILAIYIDDGLIAASSEEDIESLLNYLQNEFEITSGSLDCYLGLEIIQCKNGDIRIHQNGYAQKILRKFKLENCNPISIPADPHHSMHAEDHPKAERHAFPYREAVGSLMYLATATRPDIAFAISSASRHLENPQPCHWAAVKRIFRYIKGTAEYGLTFKSLKSLTLYAYSDADYAGDLETRRSTTGYVFNVGSGAISWCSQRQDTVAQSTTESEYIAASQSLKELIWLKNLLQEIVGSMNIPKLYIDNQSAIKLIKNPEFHRRTKHIDVKYHFIRENFEKHVFEPEYICTDNQLADILTKPLSKEKFERFRQLIGIQ